MFFDDNINLFSKPEKKILKGKKNHHISFRNIDRKLFDNILANEIHQYIHYEQKWFIPEL